MSVEQPRKKRVLILLSDTGGGHRASACGLQDAFYRAFGKDKVEVIILDLWTKHGLWPFNAFVSIYQFASSHPSSWYLVYNSIQSPISRSIFINAGFALCHRNFSTVFRDLQPDLIVSVHPLCQHVPIRVVREKMNVMDIPIATVVTDLGDCHPTWFHPEVDRLYVPSETLRQAAIKEGVSSAKVRCLGLPLRQPFWTKPEESVATVRSGLGLSCDYPTCILVGGGEGVGQMDSFVVGIIEAMFASSKEIESVVKDCVGTGRSDSHNTANKLQLIVVCGKNETTKKNVIKLIERFQELGLTIDLEVRNDDLVERLVERTPPDDPTDERASTHVRCVVYGFASRIDVLMAASDIIVTKAGPGTIAEASTRGLPVILSSYLPGQEEGNVTFVLENGFGTYCTDPKLIGVIVRKWTGDPQYKVKMSNMRGRSFQSSNPTASLDIASDLGNLIGL